MSSPLRRLSLLQCLVGGSIGFGGLSGIFCLATGGNFWVWLYMTGLLTVGYTAYFYIRTVSLSQEKD